MADKIFLRMRHRGQGAEDNRSFNIGYITNVDDTNSLAFYSITDKTNYHNTMGELKTAYGANYGLTSIADTSGTDLSAFIGNYLNVGDVVDFYDLAGHKLGISMKYEKNDYHVGDSNATHVFSFWSEEYDIGFMAYFDPTDGIFLNVNKVYADYTYSDIDGLLSAVDDYVANNRRAYELYSLAHPRLLPIVPMSKIHSADPQYLRNVTSGVDYTNAKFLCIYSGKYPASEVYFTSSDDDVSKRISALNGIFAHGLSTTYNFYEFVKGKAKVTTEYILDEDDNKIQLTKVFGDSVVHETTPSDGLAFVDYQIGTALKSTTLKSTGAIDLTTVDGSKYRPKATFGESSYGATVRYWGHNAYVCGNEFWNDETFKQMILSLMPIEVFNTVGLYTANGNGSSVYLIINPDYNDGIRDGLATLETVDSWDKYPVYLGALDAYGYSWYNAMFRHFDSMQREHISYNVNAILDAPYFRFATGDVVDMSVPQTWIDMFGITYPEEPPQYDFPNHPEWSGTDGGYGTFDDTTSTIARTTDLDGVAYVDNGNIEYIGGLYPYLFSHHVSGNTNVEDCKIPNAKESIETLMSWFSGKSIKDRSDYISEIVNMKLLFMPDDPTAVGAVEYTLQLGEDGNTGAKVRPVPQYHILPLGSVDITNYFDSFANFAPSTTIKVHLPFAGEYEVDANVYVGKTVYCYCIIDVITGDIGYQLVVDGNVCDVFVGNCAIDVTLSAEQNNKQALAGISLGLTTLGLLGTAVSGVGGLGAMTLASGAKSIIGNAIEAVTPPARHSKQGTLSNRGLFTPLEAYFEIDYAEMNLPENYQKMYGYPCNITKCIGDVTGFTKVGECHLDGIPATKPELDEIEALLKSGVIVK